MALAIWHPRPHNIRVARTSRLRPLPLRSYQTRQISDLHTWLGAGGRELLLESPVGSGKTTTVQALAAALLASGERRLVVVLVPQNLLKQGWSKAPVVDLPDALPPARVIGEVRDLSTAFWRTARGFYIVSRQALTSKRGTAVITGLAAGDLADVLVVPDEGHHCADVNTSGKMLAMLRERGAATLLVSATPFATAGHVGEHAQASRLPEAEYVCAFSDDDPSRPPSEFVIDRVFVGAPVSDAKTTIDRSGTSRKVVAGGDELHAGRMVGAMAERWQADGFPRAVFNVPLTSWRDVLARALRRAWKAGGRQGAPDLLDLVGDVDVDVAQARLAADSAATRWADVQINAVMSCARMDEGTDWVPCSHVYNAGIPAVAGLILQRWGRAARAKGRIEGYPAEWRDARTLVFFTPPGTGEGDSWKAQAETAWLLSGFVADYEAARAWTQDRIARNVPDAAALPVPESTPEVQKWSGRLSEQVERVGGVMEPTAAREWLVKQGAPVDVAETVIRRQQMTDPEHRKAEERRASRGLCVKADRRPDAEPLIEEFTTLLRSKNVATYLFRFTALDTKINLERMRLALDEAAVLAQQRDVERVWKVIAKREVYSQRELQLALGSGWGRDGNSDKSRLGVVLDALETEGKIVRARGARTDSVVITRIAA